jgi:hypothetical protein
MARKLQRALLLLVVWALTATPCWANPMDVTPLLAFAILSESVIVAAFLVAIGLDFVRVFYTWTGITLVTWVLMLVAVVASRHLIGKEVLPDDATTSDGVPIIAEVVVVAVEAWLLVLVSRRSFFRRPGATRLAWGKAVLISFVANSVSVLLGYLSA